MNDIIQSILVFLAIGCALGYLLKKFFWKPKNTSKACGNNDCGCH